MPVPPLPASFLSRLRALDADIIGKSCVGWPCPRCKAVTQRERLIANAQPHFLALVEACALICDEVSLMDRPELREKRDSLRSILHALDADGGA